MCVVVIARVIAARCNSAPSFQKCASNGSWIYSRHFPQYKKNRSACTTDPQMCATSIQVQICAQCLKSQHVPMSISQLAISFNLVDQNESTKWTFQGHRLPTQVRGGRVCAVISISISIRVCLSCELDSQIPKSEAPMMPRKKKVKRKGPRYPFFVQLCLCYLYLRTRNEIAFGAVFCLQAVDSVRCRHILVKHCNSRRPSSWKEV